MLRANLQIKIFIMCFLLFSCSTHAKLSVKKNKNNIDPQLHNELSENSKNIESLNTHLDSLSKLISVINSDLHQSLILLNNEIDLIRLRVDEIDSTYYQNSNNLYLIKDQINSLSQSYNEIAHIESNNKIEDIPPISELEFKNKYIESLNAYQNGNLKLSLSSFEYLISLGTNYDLLDNCEYWRGEIFFKMKKYHHAIDSFEKVLLYMESNRHDDALYKLATCYVYLGNDIRANYELDRLLRNYPNSEYVSKAKLMLSN
ncbi:MAG: hypothetical protein CMG64_02970 [Candidatus Marinimicrobia bacterium]|nr:hypothetical protein [Candidatus Neomarinimicrobiota bacterium]